MLFLFATVLFLSMLFVQRDAAAQSDTLDLASAMQPVPPAAAFRDPGYYVWCGTMVHGTDGMYHLFYSRWKVSTGFESWVTASEVAHAVGATPIGPFRFHDVALPPRGAQMWDGMVTHNPTVQKFGKKYYLYYMGNTGDGIIMPTLNWTHRNHQRIGVAVANSPNGPWQRMDHPLIDVSANATAPDSLAVANPSVTRARDGSYLLLYKAVGRQKPLPFGGPVVHLMATARSPTGPFEKNLSPMFTMAGSNFPFEDPFLWYDSRRDTYFVIMKDNHGTVSGTGRSSLVLYGSRDARDWRPSAHLLVSDLVVKWAGKPAQTVARMERPQIFFDDHGKAKVLLVAIYENAITSYNVRIPLR